MGSSSPAMDFCVVSTDCEDRVLAPKACQKGLTSVILLALSQEDASLTYGQAFTRYALGRRRLSRRICLKRDAHLSKIKSRRHSVLRLICVQYDKWGAANHDSHCGNAKRQRVVIQNLFSRRIGRSGEFSSDGSSRGSLAA
jgi:hypothetical protein